MRYCLAGLSLCLLLFSTLAVSHVPPTANNSTSLVTVLKKDTPAVVQIIVSNKVTQVPPPSDQASNPNPIRKRSQFSEGSGVIINAKQGLIVTNAHVVKNAKQIFVLLTDSRRYLATVVGKDKGFDIAVLKIHARDLHQISFGNSDNIAVGDIVTAIGSPFGLDQTVTSGVVSAVNVSRPKIEGFQSFIQTDAAINPGSSGGPLLNLNGNIIGINTAILGPGANIGIGFAIPSNMVHSIVAQLLKYGNVKRGMLGVVAQNISPDLRRAMRITTSHGTLVAQTVDNSPAAKAGLKPEDIITTINGHRIDSAEQLRNFLGLMRPASNLTIAIIRHHKKDTLKATLGDPKIILKQHATPFLSGMQLRNFKELKSTGKILTGAIVAHLTPTSEAALAGLQSGDVITSANHHPIHNLNDLEKVIAGNPDSLLVKITRGNISAFMVIRRPLG